LYVPLQDTRPQRDQKLPAIRVVLEAGLAMLPTNQDVANRARILDSELARHDRDAGGTTQTCC
jgi:hypothetical protein